MARFSTSAWEWYRVKVRKKDGGATSGGGLVPGSLQKAAFAWRLTWSRALTSARLSFLPFLTLFLAAGFVFCLFAAISAAAARASAAAAASASARAASCAASSARR